uniref:Interleukin 25 n=1 Tax=Sarcophilus harrisii TaxID=9305 RepID=A0A7N4P5X9_SARHA
MAASQGEIWGPFLSLNLPVFKFLQLTGMLMMAVGTQALHSRFQRDCNHHKCSCNREQDPLEELLRWDSVPSLPFEDSHNLQLPNVKVPASSQCRASRNGPLNSRALSPWSYVLDRDENRLPQDLYHAYCLCSHCIDLRTGRKGFQGNSVQLWHNQTVFYRRPCHPPGQQPGRGCYYLEKMAYPVSFACVCVLPRLSD